jgi:hypothetical protein
MKGNFQNYSVPTLWLGATEIAYFLVRLAAEAVMPSGQLARCWRYAGMTVFTSARWFGERVVFACPMEGCGLFCLGARPPDRSRREDST